MHSATRQFCLLSFTDVPSTGDQDARRPDDEHCQDCALFRVYHAHLSCRGELKTDLLYIYNRTRFVLHLCLALIPALLAMMSNLGAPQYAEVV